nr:hypothetical protein [Gemmatimonadaceae bacterium]
MSSSAVTVSSDGYIQQMDPKAAMDTYAADFAELTRARSTDPLWLRKQREDAFAQFQKAGFPTMRDEDWHFTNVAPIAERTFSLAKPA